jgi:hypothetical protein
MKKKQKKPFYYNQIVLPYIIKTGSKLTANIIILNHIKKKKNKKLIE